MYFQWFGLVWLILLYLFMQIKFVRIHTIAMEETLGSATTTINSSNIGFQVLSYFPFFHFLFSFFSLCSCNCKCNLGWCYFSLQLLKKHGWKEGTGLGISEQVFSRFHSSMKDTDTTLSCGRLDMSSIRSPWMGEVTFKGIKFVLCLISS